jgi:hypothetical protein
MSVLFHLKKGESSTWMIKFGITHITSVSITCDLVSESNNEKLRMKLRKTLSAMIRGMKFILAWWNIHSHHSVSLIDSFSQSSFSLLQHFRHFKEFEIEERWIPSNLRWMFSDQYNWFLFGLVRVSAPLQILSLSRVEHHFETKRSTKGSPNRNERRLGLHLYLAGCETGHARGSGLKYFDSSISPHSKNSPLKSGEFESFFRLLFSRDICGAWIQFIYSTFVSRLGHHDCKERYIRLEFTWQSEKLRDGLTPESYHISIENQWQS